MPKPSHSKLKYALLGSAIPLAVLLGKALLSKPAAPKAEKGKERTPERPSSKR